MKHRRMEFLCGAMLAWLVAGCASLCSDDPGKTSLTHVMLIFDKSGSMASDAEGREIPGNDVNPKSRFAIAWKFVEDLIGEYADPTMSTADEFRLDTFVFDKVVRRLPSIAGRRGALERFQRLKSDFKPIGSTDIIGAIIQTADHIRKNVEDKTHLLVVLVTDGEQTEPSEMSIEEIGRAHV